MYAWLFNIAMNYLSCCLSVIADPVNAEYLMKTSLEKDDVMNTLKVFIGNGLIFAPGMGIYYVLSCSAHIIGTMY